MSAYYPSEARAVEFENGDSLLHKLSFITGP